MATRRPSVEITLPNDGVRIPPKLIWWMLAILGFGGGGTAALTNGWLPKAQPVPSAEQIERIKEAAASAREEAARVETRVDRAEQDIRELKGTVSRVDRNLVRLMERWKVKPVRGEE